MKPIPELINKALDSLNNDNINGHTIVNGGKIANKYKGYISSFGGSIVQMGIMPTCMAFMADDNKKKLAKLLFSVYKAQYNNTITQDLDKFLKDKWNDNDFNRKKFRNQMANIAVSFKLAIRTYEFVEDEN